MRSAHEKQYVEYVTARLPTLRRLAYLLCGDEHRADDVVQVAITNLYVHWAKARAADNIDSYVRAMVVRSFLTEQRRGWLQRVKLVGGPDQTPALPAPSGPDVETRQVVHAALAKVPPRQRAVLVLRFLYDLPVAEVAELLSCSQGNVKSQTSLGLAAVKRQLGANTAVMTGKE